MPSMMTMSPDVQAYSQTPGPEQAESLVKQRFSEMAYSVLYAKHPELVPSIATFKIIKVDADTGSGLAAFVLLTGGKTLYIPVVMSAGSLKPFDMFYLKDLNVFLPLSREWVAEIDKMSLDSMGESVKDPQHAVGDVDLRDIIYPPVMATGGGRNVLASAEDENVGVRVMYKVACETTTAGVHEPVMFLHFVRNAPAFVADGLKLAFEQNPNLLQMFVKNYGVRDLTSAIREGSANRGKVASAETPRISFYTRDSDPKDIQDAFGEYAPKVAQEIVRRGMFVYDTRRYVDGQIEKVAANYDESTSLGGPSGSAGWYRLYFADRPSSIYYVIPFPHNEEGEQQSEYNNTTDVQSNRNIERTSTGNEQKRPVEYVAISADCKDAWTAKDILGEPLTSSKEVEDTALYKKLTGKTRPKSGDKGLFVSMTDRGVKATVPVQIAAIVDEGDGFKHYHIENYPSKFVQSDRVGRRSFAYRKGVKGQAEGVVLVPDDAVWVSVDRMNTTPMSLFKDPKHVRLWVKQKLQDIGGVTPKVACFGDNNVWIVGSSTKPLDYIDALAKVATDYGVSIPTAKSLLKEASTYGKVDTVLLPIKLAQPMGAMPQEEAQMMEQQQGMDPSMQQQGMDPAMQQQPPSMSPTDLAIGEAVSQLQQQMQMQQQQAESQMQQVQTQMETAQNMTQQLVGVLQGIQQRSQEIGQASGGVIPPESMGADPEVMAQSVAPTQEPPPPQPVMDTEGEPSPEMMAEQINPELVEQADELNNNRVFDTAAISMLAASPLVQEIVSSYVPNLERAVDNLGRILLSLWAKEDEVKAAVGDEDFAMLEDKTRNVFRGLGDVILTLNKSAVTSQDSDTQKQTQLYDTM
jgi:hypothetical protein